MFPSPDATQVILSRDQFERRVPRSLAPGQPAAFCIVNLLQFRRINYALGFLTGDAFLAAAEARLAQLLPPGALAARVGARFPVLLLDHDQERAASFADRLREAFAQPLRANGFGCELSVHVGIALWPAESDWYRLLFRRADLALFQAQQLGVAVGVYDPARDPHTPQRLALLAELRAAIARGELGLYCQPIVSMSDGQVVGAEALVRWHHPEHGDIPPSDFVPLLENTDLMMLLTEHMLRESARQSAAWTARGLRIRLAVNLSGRDVSTLRLSKILPTILDGEGVDSQSLALEVTENALLDNPQDSIIELNYLRRQGFELHIDDFGTGFSSLAFLAELPIQVLKIDRSLTLRMLNDPRAATIVRATIRLAHELDLTVVAEGTADRTLWVALQELDCDMAQGHYVAEPFPAGQMEDWLASSPYALSAI